MRVNLPQRHRDTENYFGREEVIQFSICSHTRGRTTSLWPAPGTRISFHRADVVDNEVSVALRVANRRQLRRSDAGRHTDNNEEGREADRDALHAY